MRRILPARSSIHDGLKTPMVSRLVCSSCNQIRLDVIYHTSVMLSIINYPRCWHLDSLFLVNHVLLHFHLDCLCAVAIDHQILHSSDPGFLQSLQKGHPTGIGLPLAELEPDGLDGMIAIQRGSNPNLPPIPTVPTVDEEHVSTLLELHCILQHAEGDEHLGSDGVSLHLFQMSPQYSRFMMENCPFVIGMYGHALFSAAMESQSLLILLPAERSACVETAHNSSFPFSAFKLSRHITASSSSPQRLNQRVVTFFGVL